MSYNFKSKKIIISPGATGIGWATAKECLEIEPSLVPPPTSTIKFPIGSFIGRPDPIAAASGC